MENNIIPNDVIKYINFKPNKYENNNSIWKTIGLKIIKENNQTKKYKLVFTSQNYQKEINILTINKNDKLDKDSIYIGIFNNKNNNQIRKIIYYGNYDKTIIINNEQLFLFKNNKSFSYKFGKLYKIFTDLYKKYGLLNFNLNSSNVKETLSNNFLFKKNIIIPEDLIIKINNQLVTSFSPNEENEFEAENRALANYIKNIKNNNIVLNNNLEVINKNNIKKNSKIIKLKNCTINNNLNNNKLYFAYIKYKFSDNEVFDKIIYLGNFIKNDDNFFFFENIIINPNAENLEEFNLYCNTSNLPKKKFIKKIKKIKKIIK